MYRNHLSPPVFPYSWASEWGQDVYGLWMALTYNDVRYVFRWIQPGQFMMGSPDDEKDHFWCEAFHQVTLTKGFWMAETPVTQALWQAVMDQNPSNFKGENRPVERVSWDDIQIYIRKFNHIHSDLNVGLPTEVQWEYACRAGAKTSFNFGEDLTLSKVNYRGTWQWIGSNIWCDGAKKETTEVASYPCNDWGLFDMHGNVWEWCQDVWQGKLSAEPVIDPGGAAEGEHARAGAERVSRGGSWVSNGMLCRSAYRDGSRPDGRSSDLGFRLVLGH